MRESDEPVSIGLLAGRLHISRFYLENLMLIMKRKGLVRPSRGPKGGYSLAKAPADINVCEVFVALEGTDGLVPCVTCPECCPESGHCTSRDLFDFLGETVSRTLSTITLEDMARQQSLELSGG